MTDQADAAQETPRPCRKPPQRGRAGGRRHQKVLRLTDAEAAALDAKAQAAGLSVASYLRASALGDSGPRARRRPTVDRAALIDATAELNRVGNNINQIARALNRGREAEAATATLEELRAVLRAVMGALQR